MHRIVIYVVLLMHFNLSFLNPLADDSDRIDCYGKPVGDIDSIVDYYNAVILNRTNRTPEDQDDDQPYYYRIIHLDFQWFTDIVCRLRDVYSCPVARTENFPESERSIAEYLSEILSPPPEIC